MKTSLVLASALVAAQSFIGAEPDTNPFPQEKIGVPPLSLSQSLKQPKPAALPPKFGAVIPSVSGEGSRTPPALVPPQTSAPVQMEARRRQPTVSRSAWGMPVIEPRDDVDYKMIIVPPNPAIDFKLHVKDPTPAPAAPATPPTPQK
jgi:hypothetical protein